MPLLTDRKRINELRKQFPILTHTSGMELSEILPHPNTDKHHQQMGDIVCATCSDSDFYALRSNEKKGMINYSLPYRDSQGTIRRIFIFEKMKDTYYEHVVSSKNFIPVVSKEGIFDGEWISYSVIRPVSVKKGSKEDILKQTKAKVFIIADVNLFKEKLHNDAFVKMLRTADKALEAINGLVREGILKEVNGSQGLVKKLSKITRNEEGMVSGKTLKREASVRKQEAILSR